MSHSIFSPKNNLPNTPKLRLHIFGPNMVQNELLMSYLREDMDAECHSYETISPGFNLTGAVGYVDMILIDCQNREAFNPWSTFPFENARDARKGCLLFFNVSRDSDIDQSALAFGIRGIFYHGDSYEIMSKGIKAVLNGELWFSRKALTNCVIDNKSDGRIPSDQSDCLTLREKEILCYLATGTGNREIASTLSISLHTVKTHIYNIFKKINVKNRFQASLWAAKYI